MSIQEILETIRAAPEPPNEEAAKFKVIAPILNGLGWSPCGSDVEFEQSVGGGKGAGKIDIALKGPQRLVALIEAKSPGVKLNDHVAQLLGYAFHEGVDICALTTGLEWWFYLPLEKGPPEKRRFAVLKVREESADRLAQDFEDFLGRNALLSGAAHKRAQNVLEAEHRRALLSEQIPNIWRKMVNEADEELVEALTSRVYEKVNLRPDREQVIAVIQGRPVSDSTTPREPQATKQPQPESASNQTPKAPSRKPSGVVIFNERYEVNTYRQGYCELVKRLYQLKPRELMGLRNSRGVPCISNTPENILNPFEVGPGCWIESHASSKNLIQRGEKMLTGLGYKADDFEFVFDEPVAGSTTPREPQATKQPQPESASNQTPKAPSRKPTGILIFGQRYEISTYRQGFCELVTLLYQRHPRQLIELRTSRGLPYISDSPEGLLTPFEVGPGYWINTHDSSEGLVRRGKALLQGLGYKADDFEFVFD